MNILVFSQAAWDNVNAFGNTVSNFFENWSDSTFAHFYTRKQKPDNKVVSYYYNLSVMDVVKNIFKKNDMPRRFENSDIDERFQSLSSELANERKQINLLHQFKFLQEIAYCVTEMVWLRRKWMDESFEKFIDEFKPDVFFAFATSAYILEPLIMFIKKRTGAKVVLFIADDVYNDYARKSILRKRYLTKCISKSILNADKIYGCSKELSEAYGRLFHVDIQPLYKGCILSGNVKKSNNVPLRIVYAGNMFYGRPQILEKIARIIEAINKKDIIVQLEIYTAAVISDNLRKSLERGNSSKIVGKRPYNEIKRILCEADIVLHVESFEKEQIESVRYSFSTKIIDCLQSGSGVLAVGPAGIASIEYLRNIDGVCVVDNLKALPEVLRKLVKNPHKISENAAKIFEYAKKYHNIENVRNSLKEDFRRLVSNENSSD